MINPDELRQIANRLEKLINEYKIDVMKDNRCPKWLSNQTVTQIETVVCVLFETAGVVEVYYGEKEPEQSYFGYKM